MKIYISGPIKDNPNYIEDFNSAKQRLISLGLDPLSPLDCDPREHEGDCPGGYVSGEGTHSSTCYMRADLLACRDIDGKAFGSLEEAQTAYASGGYSECEGGLRCRGIIVAVWS